MFGWSHAGEVPVMAGSDDPAHENQGSIQENEPQNPSA